MPPVFCAGTEKGFVPGAARVDLCALAALLNGVMEGSDNNQSRGSPSGVWFKALTFWALTAGRVTGSMRELFYG